MFSKMGLDIFIGNVSRLGATEVVLQVTRRVTGRERAGTEDMSMVPCYLDCVFGRCGFDMCILTRISTKSKSPSKWLPKSQMMVQYTKKFDHTGDVFKLSSRSFPSALRVELFTAFGFSSSIPAGPVSVAVSSPAVSSSSVSFRIL